MIHVRMHVPRTAIVEQGYSQTPNIGRPLSWYMTTDTSCTHNDLFPLGCNVLIMIIFIFPLKVSLYISYTNFFNISVSIGFTTLVHLIRIIMRYVSIQQTIRIVICKISHIGCASPFWTVLVSCYPHFDKYITRMLNYWCPVVDLFTTCHIAFDIDPQWQPGLEVIADSTHAHSSAFIPGTGRGKYGSCPPLPERRDVHMGVYINVPCTTTHCRQEQDPSRERLITHGAAITL